MENRPLEDVSPIEMGIFHCYVSLPEGISWDLLPIFDYVKCHVKASKGVTCWRVCHVLRLLCLCPGPACLTSPKISSVPKMEESLYSNNKYN